MATLVLESVFLDKDKNIMFDTFTVKNDIFYTKQLREVLKLEYEATPKDYNKIADLMGLDNSFVKSIFYNTIIEIIFFPMSKVLKTS